MTRQPPPLRKTKITHLTRRNATARYLAEKYRLLGTWRAVGDKIGISGGMAFRIAMQRYKPQDAEVAGKIKNHIAADYDSWLVRNMAKLRAIVAWAETSPGERVWPPRKER